MRFRILALLFLFLPLSLYAQYGSSWNADVADLTSYLPTTNVWKELPQGGTCLPNTLSVGIDGTIYCRGSNYYPYETAPQGVWTGRPEMGTNIQSLAVQDANDVYSLQPASGCTGRTFGIFKWSGSAWARTSGCLSWLSVGSDGTLVGDNLDNQLTYESADGGNTWTQISGGSVGPHLTFVSAASGSKMCGTNGIQVFVWGPGGPFNLLASQPNNADTGVYGCVYDEDQNEQADSVYIWGSSLVRVQRYDINAGTWSNVDGMNTTEGLTTAGKGALLGLDSSGHPYHLNVYGASLSLTIQGSDVNGCGSGGCSGASHLITTQVQFPDSLTGGNSTQQQYDPAANMSQTSTDFTASCDWLFGSPSDPKCTPKVILGTVFCSKLLSTIFSVQMPQITQGRSYDARAFDGSFQAFGYESTAVGAYLAANCGIDKMKGANACVPGTAPTCPVPFTQKKVDDTCVGDPATSCSESTMETGLLGACKTFKPGGLAWAMQVPYVTITDGGKTRTACFNGHVTFFVRKYPVKCQ